MKGKNMQSITTSSPSFQGIGAIEKVVVNSRKGKTIKTIENITTTAEQDKTLKKMANEIMGLYDETDFETVIPIDEADKFKEAISKMFNIRLPMSRSAVVMKNTENQIKMTDLNYKKIGGLNFDINF